MNESNIKRWEDWNSRQSLKFDAKKTDIISYLHKTHVGGSDAGALLGVSKWNTAASIYDRMMSDEIENGEDNFVFARGHACEGFVGQQAGKLLHMKVTPGALYTDLPVRPWSIGQVDAFIGEDKIPLEIKVATFNVATDDGKTWGRGSVINENGEIAKEDDLIPPEYFLQCQKQMYFTHKEYMYLAAWLTFENRVRIYVIHRDPELIQKIIKAEDDFIFNNVLAGVRPDETSPAEDAQETHDKSKVYEADEAFSNLVHEYNELNHKTKELKERMEDIKTSLAHSMNDCGTAVNKDGKKLLSITEVKTQRFDSKKFSAEHADLYGQYLKETFGGFRFTFAKEA